jgi:hypothetical protein
MAPANQASTDMPKLYSLEIISDNRPLGFVEYRIKTPNSENNIAGMSKDAPEVFQIRMKKALDRLNFNTGRVWAIDLATARINGKRAIDASLQARRLAKEPSNA